MHERALRLVYKDQNSTFEELLSKNKLFTVHQRNLQKLATEMYKAKNKLSPSFMTLIFPHSENQYDMRTPNYFKTHNIMTVHNGSETISFRGPIIWRLVPDDIKISKSLSEFKAKIKEWRPDGCTCRICKVYVNGLGFL